MISYVLLFSAIALFGVSFFANGRYQQGCGSSLLTSAFYALGNGVFGFLSLLLFNCLSISLDPFEISFQSLSLAATPFTLLMALWFAVNGIIFAAFSIYSLGRASLSLYSLFSMMGGMAMPSVVGMLCYGEAMTLGKGICFVLTAIGLVLTVKPDRKKGDVLCYVGVFVFNGIAATISTVFSKADPEIFAKSSSAVYSIWGAAFKAVIAAALLPLAFSLSKKLDEKRKSEDESAEILPLSRFGRPGVILWLALCGFCSTVANFLLPLVMKEGGLDSSLVYSMNTGGIMVMSTCLGFLNTRKPTLREILSVIICTAGMAALLVL